jgi:hypothetical protein
MTDKQKNSICNAIDFLTEVRTGEDFECDCYDAARDLYMSFRNDIEDRWDFEESI